MNTRVLDSIRALQDGLVHRLGSAVEQRPSLVSGMLERNANDAMSYWLQLVVSVGIATLGLVIGSTAVIIGAMLVAPLMGPILALAMGLATGSPFLVLRSSGRIVLSVGVAIGGAAIITLLVPFHQLNAEIAARTAPTVLDLLTAGFCALAGVYAALRPGSDTATTAAGTSIGISLVPPLCTSGYGLGTVTWPIAGGAALLFLTNLVAIIVVGTISFVLAGFNRIDVTRMERDELAKTLDTPITATIARRLAGLFESKAGPLLRFLMPLLLLAIVYVPLRRALDEVAWQVRVRAAVHRSLEREPREIVQSRVRVERHEVDVLVVLVGSTSDAEASRERLDDEVRAAAGVGPRIEVLAIPDATAISGLESTFSGLETTFSGLETELRAAEEIARRAAEVPAPAPVEPPPAPPSATEQLERGRELVRASVMRLWPAASAGEPLAIDVDATERGPLRVAVSHVGAKLGAAGVEGLGRSLGAALEHDVEVVDVAITADPLTRSDGDLVLVARVASAAAASAAIPGVGVCVVEPRPPQGRRRVDPRERELADALHRALAGHPRVTTEEGDAWSVRFVHGACPSPTPGEVEAPGPTLRRDTDAAPPAPARASRRTSP